MRSEINKIEKTYDVDMVLNAIYDNYEVIMFLSRKLEQMVKKYVTKQRLSNYLKEIEFSGFGKNGYRNLEDLSAQFFYDYVRHLDEYDDILIGGLDKLMSQYPKKELVYAINILGGRVPPDADLNTLRRIARDELLKSDDDYYNTYVNGLEEEVLYDIYDLFEKWFFPNYSMKGYKSHPVKKRSPSVRVNVRRMF